MPSFVSSASRAKRHAGARGSASTLGNTAAVGASSSQLVLDSTLSSSVSHQMELAQMARSPLLSLQLPAGFCSRLAWLFLRSAALRGCVRCPPGLSASSWSALRATSTVSRSFAASPRIARSRHSSARPASASRPLPRVHGTRVNSNTVLPNPSLELTPSGVALGPRYRHAYHRSRGPSAMPALAAQLKR